MSDMKPNRNRHRSEFLHIRTLRGMSLQDQVDFCWTDMKRFFKVMLWDRGHKCCWGECPFPDQIIDTFEEASLDHTIPRSKGGRTRLSNVQLMHPSCNTKKSSREVLVSRKQYLKALTPPNSHKSSVTKYMMKKMRRRPI